MITATTKLLGLLGNPVSHSLSPIFMNYVLRRLKLDYRYLAFKVASENLKKIIEVMKALDIRGVNVTIPFKERVIDFIDEIDDGTAKIGAVNCIVNNNGRLYGFNTDYTGFLLSIKPSLDIIRKNPVLVIGCGGAARAVVYALISIDVPTIYIANRTKVHAEEFCGLVKATLGYKSITYIGDPSVLTDSTLEKVNFVVNTTPVGMHPYVEDSPIPQNVHFSSHHIVYDLIYNPWETRFLSEAYRDGTHVKNGFSMLIYQGLESLTHWFPDKKDVIIAMYEDTYSFTKEYAHPEG